MPTHHWKCDTCKKEYPNKPGATGCERTHRLGVPCGFKTKELKNEFDFLPEIQKTEHDMSIMRSWTTHFRSLGIPFRISKEENGYVLWKEQYVEPRVY